MSATVSTNDQPSRDLDEIETNNVLASNFPFCLRHFHFNHSADVGCAARMDLNKILRRGIMYEKN